MGQNIGRRTQKGPLKNFFTRFAEKGSNFFNTLVSGNICGSSEMDAFLSQLCPQILLQFVILSAYFFFQKRVFMSGQIFSQEAEFFIHSFILYSTSSLSLHYIELYNIYINQIGRCYCCLVELVASPATASDTPPASTSPSEARAPTAGPGTGTITRTSRNPEWPPGRPRHHVLRRPHPVSAGFAYRCCRGCGLQAPNN
jgi:hypothetical protein